MSIEAPISGAGAISAPAISMSIESGHKAPMINTPIQIINAGGVNNPDINNIFSLPEHKVSFTDTFDKPVPGNLAFTHTDIVWQAPQTHKTEVLTPQATPIDIFETPQKEIMQETTFSPASIPDRIKTNYDYDAYMPQIQTLEKATEATKQLIRVQPEPIAELDAPTDISVPEAILASEISLQEIRADTEQAAKVENSLIAIGVQVEEAEESSMTMLKETLDKKGITQELTQVEEEKLVNDASNAVGKDEGDNDMDLKTEDDIDSKPQLAKIYFEHDVKTDSLRQKIAEEAIAESAGQLRYGEKQSITGADIAEKMPVSPQPKAVKSEILKDAKAYSDGSYENAIKEIKSIGTIYSANHAKSTINAIINNNHAVSIALRKPSQEASREEVQKVLKNGVIVDNRSII